MIDPRHLAAGRQENDGPLRLVGGGHDVGDEAFVVAIRAQLHDGLGDLRERHRLLLDLFQLDALAANLDLPVAPPEVLDLAVRPSGAPGRRCDRGGRRSEPPWGRSRKRAAWSSAGRRR